jgi:hypothetical protein
VWPFLEMEVGVLYTTSRGKTPRILVAKEVVDLADLQAGLETGVLLHYYYLFVDHLYFP